MNNGSDPSGVLYALFGILTAAVGALIWVVKYFANTLSHDLQNHTRAAEHQVSASNASTKASKAMLVFMKDVDRHLTKLDDNADKREDREARDIKRSKK